MIVESYSVRALVNATLLHVTPELQCQRYSNAFLVAPEPIGVRHRPVAPVAIGGLPSGEGATILAQISRRWSAGILILRLVLSCMPAPARVCYQPEIIDADILNCCSHLDDNESAAGS